MQPIDIEELKRGGVLLIDKPLKITSFGVVNKVRYAISKAAGVKRLKVGHAGTLDPLATGLLILCTGGYTKRIHEFQNLEKEYTGTITLGAVTESYDLEKEPVAFGEYTHIHEEQIKETAKIFLGAQQQMPPIHSAKKIDGERAYAVARRGEVKEMKANTVEISAFEIVSIALPVVQFRVVCSKGTYIRSLAHDFGQILGCGGHLSSLCRTRIGASLNANAWNLEELLDGLHAISCQGQD